MIDVLPKYQFYKKERCAFDGTPFTVIGARRGGGGRRVGACSPHPLKTFFPFMGVCGGFFLLMGAFFSMWESIFSPHVGPFLGLRPTPDEAFCVRP